MFTNNTRIIDLTVAEFESILARHFPKDEPKAAEPDKVIRGLKAIAEVLGISEKTLTRWRKEKVITAPTIKQVGGVITANRNELLNFKPTKKWQR